MRFQTKSESRVDGFVLALAWLAISHASCARLRVTDKITPFTTNNNKKVVFQGFRQVFKVADIILKAPDAIFFGGARRLASAEGSSYLRGSGGMLPQTDF